MRLLVPATRLFLLLLFIAAGCAVSRPVARLDSTPVSAELAILPTPVPELGALDASGEPAPLRRHHVARTASTGQVGTASFYGDEFDGRTTASGDTFDQSELTAAHRSFHFGTRLRVTNLENRRSVVVTVNDRGPYVGGRMIDLSKRAARVLGFVEDGTTRVRVQPL